MATRIIGAASAMLATVLPAALLLAAPASADAAHQPAIVKVLSTGVGDAHQHRLYERPMWNGYRLDWCLNWGTDCGQAPANAWCQMTGNLFAQAFAIDQNIGAGTPTHLIGSGQICAESYCNGFKYIDCVR